MPGRRLLILMLVLQLAGWWWLHVQLPYLGTGSHPRVWHGAERTTLFKSLDGTPVYKEEYLRFDLVKHAWQSLNRRQMFAEDAELRHVPAFWQLTSPRGGQQNYGAEQFDRHTLAVLKRRQLPFTDFQVNAVDSPRIVGNRWVIQVTETAIDYVDLEAEALTVNSLPRIASKQFSYIIVSVEAAANPAVWIANSVRSAPHLTAPTGAELYRFDTTGQLRLVSQWNIAEMMQSVVTWQDKVASIEPGRNQIEVRSQVDGQILGRTELAGFSAVDWVPHSDTASAPVFRVHRHQSPFYDIEAGEYLAHPRGAIDLIDSLPGRKLLLFQLLSGQYVVFDPARNQTVWTTSALHSEVHLREQQSTTLVDRMFGLSFYKLDHASQRVVETYRPFLWATWGCWGLSALYVLWSLAWIGALPAGLLRRTVFAATPGTENLQDTSVWTSVWLDVMLVIALPLLLCSYRLATRGSIDSDRPAFQIALALCYSLGLLLSAWLVLGDTPLSVRLRSAFPLGLTVLAAMAVMLSEHSIASRLMQVLALAMLLTLNYLQILRMLGFRLVHSSVKRANQMDERARVTLMDYFVITMLVALLLGLLTPRFSVWRSMRPIELGVLTILVSQVLLMHLALARRPAWFALGATLAWTCLGMLCAVLALQMFVGLWLPDFGSYDRMGTLLLAISASNVAAFLPHRMRGYRWCRNTPGVIEHFDKSPSIVGHS